MPKVNDIVEKKQLDGYINEDVICRHNSKMLLLKVIIDTEEDGTIMSHHTFQVFKSNVPYIESANIEVVLKYYNNL